MTKCLENDLEDVDPVAELLLRESDSACTDGLNDGRESFNKETIVLLLGLGLSGEDVQKFERHEIGLEKFITLTSNDLDYIGIAPNKKSAVMTCIRKIRRKYEPQSLPSQEAHFPVEYCPEDGQALENVLRHQQTLLKIFPYMRQYLNMYCGSIYFHTGISTNHTLEKVAYCCLLQAVQVKNHLQLYQLALEQEDLPRRAIWSKYRKWWFLALIAGSCVSLAMWGTRREHVLLPMDWLKSWQV